MAAHRVTLIPGDGIGPEVTSAAVRILDAAGAKIGWETFAAGSEAYEKYHEYIPKELIESIERTTVGLKGPVTTPIGGGFSSINVALRKRFELYANFRPIRNLPSMTTRYPGVDLAIVRENTEGLYSGIEHEVVPGVVESLKIMTEKACTRIARFAFAYANFRPIRNLPSMTTRYPGVDLAIVRENTEGLYSGIEHEVVPGVVESLKIMTEKACTRIARFAFAYARRERRKRIHAIHKANIMKMSDGLFLRCCREVAQDFPEITYGEHIIDNTCMQLVMNPYQYDVLVMENLYGDIISDLCAAFVGGLGLVPGANIGERCAIFEAVHGSAPDIAGKDLANPTAVLQSAILMLRHLGETEIAGKIHRALEKTYKEKQHLTRDVGGTAHTTEFTDAVIANLEAVAVASGD